MQGYQLTFFTQQDHRHHGKSLAHWLVEEARAMGIGGATLFAASEGYGHHRRIHSVHFIELTDQPLEVVMAVSPEDVAEQLRGYLPGWKAYFRLAQTPRVFRALDEWLRHRLRAIQLKHWRRGTTTYRALRALGASGEQAAKVAGNTRRWWHNSCLELNRLLPIAYFDRLGVPRLS